MVTPILTSAATEAKETRVNIEAEVKRREAEATGYGGGGGGQGPGGWPILRLLFGSRARYISLYIYPRPIPGISLPRGPW